ENGDRSTPFLGETAYAPSLYLLERLLDTVSFSPGLKEAHQAHQPQKTASRWDLRPLLWILLLMTWCTGNSENERFETARAFYIACQQHRKRPGTSLQGFQQALAHLPLPVLHVLFAGVRRCLQQVFYRYWRSDGLLVMACDGSRLECPRSTALEPPLAPSGNTDSAPIPI